MLGTPENKGIAFQAVPEKITRELTEAFNLAKRRFGDFEAVVIRPQDGNSYNLQLHMKPNKTFLEERLSLASPIEDFGAIVESKFSN